MPIECTRREVWEETGIDTLPDPIEYLKIGYGYYYLFVLSHPYVLSPQDTNEIVQTAWVSIEDMKSMELNADVNQFIRNQKKLSDYWVTLEKETVLFVSDAIPARKKKIKRHNFNNILPIFF